MEASYKQEIGQLRETNMDSFIEVELYQDKPYVSGDLLYGTVHLFCQEDISDVK